VLGHRGPGDRQVGRELANWLWPLSEAQDDRSPGFVAKRFPHPIILVSCH